MAVGRERERDFDVFFFFWFPLGCILEAQFDMQEQLLQPPCKSSLLPSYFDYLFLYILFGML